MCHIELVADKENDSRMYGSVWICPDPDNDYDTGLSLCTTWMGELVMSAGDSVDLLGRQLQGDHSSAYCLVCQNECGTVF
jgi:hypothetical protein